MNNPPERLAHGNTPLAAWYERLGFYHYAPDNLDRIIRQPDIAVAEQSVPSLTFPAQSITMLVVPSSTPTPVTLSHLELE